MFITQRVDDWTSPHVWTSPLSTTKLAPLLGRWGLCGTITVKVSRDESEVSRVRRDRSPMTRHSPRHFREVKGLGGWVGRYRLGSEERLFLGFLSHFWSLMYVGVCVVPMSHLWFGTVVIVIISTDCFSIKSQDSGEVVIIASQRFLVSSFVSFPVTSSNRCSIGVTFQIMVGRKGRLLD